MSKWKATVCFYSQAAKLHSSRDLGGRGLHRRRPPAPRLVRHFLPHRHRHPRRRKLVRAPPSTLWRARPVREGPMVASEAHVTFSKCSSPQCQPHKKRICRRRCLCRASPPVLHCRSRTHRLADGGAGTTWPCVAGEISRHHDTAAPRGGTRGAPGIRCGSRRSDHGAPGDPFLIAEFFYDLGR